MKKFLIRLSLPLLLVASASYAQQPPPGSLLDRLVAEALERHPALEAAASRLDELGHRSRPARSLPDPVLQIGWVGDPAPFDLVRGFPPSSRNFGVSQLIPYPGKLDLRSDLTRQDVEVARWELEALRRQVTREVKTAYFDYAYLHHARRVLAAHREILERLVEITEVRYRVGKALQQDVLKAQLELSRFRQREMLTEQQYRDIRIRLNTLRRRDPLEPLPDPEELRPAELVDSLESLVQQARENDPVLAGENQRIEKSQLAMNLAEKDRLPDFRLTYNFQQRPGLPDTHNVMVSIDLPVFYRGKQQERILEASQSVWTARHRRETRENDLRFEINHQYLAAQTARELMRLYAEALTPQSTLALESSLSAYQTGQLNFLTVLDNFQTVLESELNYHRELANYQSSLARIEPFVGVNLTQ